MLHMVEPNWQEKILQQMCKYCIKIKIIAFLVYCVLFGAFFERNLNF